MIFNYFKKIKYSYHYMDNSNEMLFRYDNTKHYPNISTFPHHKHIQNRVLESTEPEIRNILYEIELIIIRKKRTRNQ